MVSCTRLRVGRLGSGAAVAVLLAGCGDPGPAKVPLQPASGAVFVDGRPAAGVQVRFRPAADPNSLDAPVPFGKTGDDGVYTLGTYEAGDGAPTGRYKVTLYWPDRPPGPHPADDLLGGVYTLAERTPLEATIAEGDNAVPTFEVAKAAARPKKKLASRGRAEDNDGLE